MRTVFADSHYFIALLSPDDQWHGRAAAVSEPDALLVTTAWIITEVGNAMAAPIQRPAFVHYVEALRADPTVVIVPADQHLFEAGLRFFASRMDKEWSVTDCISFVVMRERGLTEALTGDHHFEQAGFKALLR